MGNTSDYKRNGSEKKPLNHINLGLLAHVDAGKTTLSEAVLYLTGSIRRLGRVDHQDAFLDTDAMERARGITIFSKQAEFTLDGWQVTLLDTPGHVDFSPEMERTLRVLDYALLVISGADGVQGQVYTLWKLLKHYRVPVFLFINKMDQPGTDRQALMEEIRRELDSRCLDFGADPQAPEMQEELALCSEELMNRYLEGEPVTEKEIRTLVRSREVFPCYFGSALKVQGVEELLRGMERYMEPRLYPEAFGARIFKISRDAKGERLTWMKITGGSLKVKTLLTGEGEEPWKEKADQLRIYSGAGYQLAQEVPAGCICAVSGLTHTRAGQGLGFEAGGEPELLEPVLTYRVLLPDDTDASKALEALRRLEEEEPMLRVSREERTGELFVRVMGQVQLEILQKLLQDRYGISASFGTGTIVYKETIRRPAEGVGHFEPLRHYAEVHLLLEPGEPGSGLSVENRCREDMLDGNWQRQILKNLEEKHHRGVLTGSEITDMRLILIAGRSHEKHTEGGDFREAAWRAVRQGLMSAESILLEPVYQFRLDLPAENLGRAMSDLQRMGGNMEPPENHGSQAVLKGTVPAACLVDYQEELREYTRGQGRLTCTLRGYEPCRNPQEVIEAIGYDPDRDLDNPSASVFCSHGAGTLVPWDQVRAHMHVDSGWRPREEGQETEPDSPGIRAGAGKRSGTGDSGGFLEGELREQELREIFERTYGPIRKKEGAADPGLTSGIPGWKRSGSRRKEAAETGISDRRGAKQRKPGREYLLVDGYNIIFAWEELKKLAEKNMDAARDKLMDILSNFQGYRPCTLILVFDAYKVPGGPGEVMKYHNIYVVYTKEAETADQYIEKTVHRIGQKHSVTVATSDALEQVIILGAGAVRLSAAGLLEEVKEAEQEIRREYLGRKSSRGNYLFDGVQAELAETLETLRLKKDAGD